MAALRTHKTFPSCPLQEKLAKLAYAVPVYWSFSFPSLLETWNLTITTVYTFPWTQRHWQHTQWVTVCQQGLEIRKYLLGLLWPPN